MKKNMLFVIIFMIMFYGCRQDKAENTIMSFKGGNLTKEDLAAHHKNLKMKSSYRNNPETLTPEFIFDHAVNMEMIIAKGLKENLHLDPWIRQEIHGFMSDLFLKVMQDRLMPKIDKAAIPEEEMKQFYEEHRDNYLKKPFYTVTMIKTVSLQKAKSIKTEIESSMITFDEAAKKYSTDKKSKNNGGVIGTRSLKKFRKEWRPVIKELEPEKISAPKKIKEDYYIFKLIKKTEPYQYTYEEKRSYIRNDVLYSKYRDEWQDVYDGLKKEFHLKIDEEKLQAFYDGFK